MGEDTGKTIILETSSKNNAGNVLTMVALLLFFVFIGVAAFAIDISNWWVARNELKNASDSGALAAAQTLYNDDGKAVNTGSNQLGFLAATTNRSQQDSVEVNWSGGNSGDVERGHWAFGLGDLPRGFYPNPSTQATILWERSEAELDADVSFINAVRVRSRREATPVAAWFGRIFGYEDYQFRRQSVAWLGFAGTLFPTEADQPIVLCEDALLNNWGEYICDVGRMINSGSNDNHQTGGWTDFNQEDPCSGGTNTAVLETLICANGNPRPIELYKDMATTGGMSEASFSDFRDCWEAATNKTRPWEGLTLPVVSCPSNNIGTCENVRGTVTVNVIWVTGAGEDPAYTKIPEQMSASNLEDKLGNPLPDWSCDASVEGREACWVSFVEAFNILTPDDLPLTTLDDNGYRKKTIYFLPKCGSPSKGGSGGKNYGVLARVPVLVDSGGQ